MILSVFLGLDTAFWNRYQIRDQVSMFQVHNNLDGIYTRTCQTGLVNTSNFWTRWTNKLVKWTNSLNYKLVKQGSGVRVGLLTTTLQPCWLKGWLVGINEGETCPAGLGRGKHAFGGWLRLGQVSLGKAKLGKFKEFVVWWVHSKASLFIQQVHSLTSFEKFGSTSLDLTTSHSILFRLFILYLISSPPFLVYDLSPNASLPNQVCIMQVCQLRTRNLCRSS